MPLPIFLYRFFDGLWLVFEKSLLLYKLNQYIKYYEISINIQDSTGFLDTPLRLICLSEKRTKRKLVRHA